MTTYSFSEVERSMRAVAPYRGLIRGLMLIAVVTMPVALFRMMRPIKKSRSADA